MHIKLHSFLLCASFPFLHCNLQATKLKKMVGTTLKRDLDNFVRTMHDQGTLDHHFDNVRALQNEENPQFVTEVILMFINDADNAIAEVTRYLDTPLVDFDKLIGFVHPLRGASSSIGGCRMALACRHLRQACDDMDKARCVRAFQSVKEEYQTLRQNLILIYELESSIQAYEMRKRCQK